MLVSLEPLLFLIILLFSWGVLFCIEVSCSDSMLSKKIRKKLYDKTKICIHNDATLQVTHDHGFPSFPYHYKDLECPLCGKKYIAEYYQKGFMRMHHIPKEFAVILERKYRRLERIDMEKIENEKRKLFIEKNLAKQDALKEKNTLDFSSYRLDKIKNQKKYKKYKKKSEDK